MWGRKKEPARQWGSGKQSRLWGWQGYPAFLPSLHPLSAPSTPRRVWHWQRNRALPCVSESLPLPPSFPALVPSYLLPPSGRELGGMEDIFTNVLISDSDILPDNSICKWVPWFQKAHLSWLLMGWMQVNGKVALSSLIIIKYFY